MSRFPINRRHALQTIGAAAAGAATSSSWVESLVAFTQQQTHSPAAQAASAAAGEWTPKILTPKQNEAVVILTELIIPETDTPGAKAARVNRFVDWVLSGAQPRDREEFLRGLAWIDQRSQQLFGHDFAGAGAENQTTLLTRLSSAPRAEGDDKIGVDFFHAIKSMTINGYYSTEIGLRQELGDSGRLFQTVSQGCDHPEHQG